VHAEPTGPGGLDKVCAGQQVKLRPGVLEAHVGERCRGVDLEVGGRVQPQQAEDPGGVLRQVLVRPRQHGSYRRTRISAGIQPVQPPLQISQFVDESGKRRGWMRDGHLGGHP